MAFFKYTQATQLQFDDDTRLKLDELVRRFGEVELNELKLTNQWCIRVQASAPDGDVYPLASLGNTALEAAQRLIRMMQFRQDDDPKN